MLTVENLHYGASPALAPSGRRPIEQVQANPEVIEVYLGR